MIGRDRSIYRHKGLRKTFIKTVMGEVEFSRAIYEQKNGNGTKSFVYLLDKAMGTVCSGYMSGLFQTNRRGGLWRNVPPGSTVGE